VTDRSPPDEEPLGDGAEPVSRLDAYIADRRAKVERLRAAGIDPYPVGVRVTTSLAEVKREWADKLAPGAGSGAAVAVAGRLVGRRGHGKLVFLVLREGDTDLQALVGLEALGPDGMERVADLDLGDWVAVEGEVVRSRRGELSVGAGTVTLIGKSLRPLPDTWHGLRDVETRFRQREVDLAVNAEARRVFHIRGAAVAALRALLLDRGFAEVETPMLHPIPGGATARPFATHHHALDIDLYLRVAPELYLKRLLAGGLPRVFEINRNFRNEGLSPRHNPEFTMLECYQAYADYGAVAELTRDLVQRAALAAVGTTALTYGGRPIDLGGEWQRRPLLDLVREATGRPDLSYRTSLDDLRVLCQEHVVRVEDGWGPGKLVLELYEKLVEPALWDPTFVVDYPVETSPLARRSRTDPDVVERFELIIAGRELANAFSELTDPEDQRRRLEQQARDRAAGDQEAMTVDEAYLRALEFGMPPAGGLGIGVDRLVMLLADVATIRDVILFPTLRPEQRGPG